MQVPQFDIFSGAIDKNALWLEAVDGLGAAFGRMKELASATPGAYFIFRTRTRQVLASIDTAARQKKEQSNPYRASARSIRFRPACSAVVLAVRGAHFI